jgi:hypothetical protein
MGLFEPSVAVFLVTSLLNRLHGLKREKPLEKSRTLLRMWTHCVPVGCIHQVNERAEAECVVLLL